jgi:hypothetical protein
MEFYPAIKSKMMSFAEKWMELEIITLNEINQFHKDKYHLFFLFVEVRGKEKRRGS